jgi:hypothetical protein
VTTTAAWGINVVNYSSSDPSYDTLYLTYTIDGVSTTVHITVRLDWGVPTHIWTDPILGLDGPPVWQLCAYTPPGEEESPDPVVTLRQSPPPTSW